jgi:hypothetical protein
MNGNLLIGTESAFADKDVDISEMDKSYPQLKAYFATNPIDSFHSWPLTNIFIHSKNLLLGITY